MSQTQTTLQRLADVVTRQDELLAKIIESQTMLQQHVVEGKANHHKEVRVEGLSMPKYRGKMDESISLYIHKVTTFFKAKNIDPQADNETQQRCMAMMVANFCGLVASWYQDRLRDKGSPPSTLVELEKELRAEFEPDDLQDRLRDELYNLRQSACADVMEYVAIFRRICTQLCDMTERDKISWFQR
ncbi:hypothetical protein THRCLA_20100 [Thraustotheca clavata]|uniref:Retrotransposon gag domain-containing protein n=1 Tax=Thraustotheca clavata TaxID=74557 RepID=A0A1W0AC98_9STRA|nr:hypothetical protein THRCLA_20100 [Thraustotheca clavata]